MSFLLEDPLDCENFDAVQYINQKFPTEASLEDLDTFIVEVVSQISQLDEEISKAVQTQSVVGRQASKDICQAQESIEELFEKISDIKLKASQSEKMVQEICADIKKLDYAKLHLQTSITSLNRLQMLIHAVEQLEILAKDYQYREVANLFDAVKQFMSHFDKYSHIPAIADLQSRVDTIRSDLTIHVRKTFREVAQAVEKVADAEIILSDLPGGMKSLSDSCLVVDALGEKMRKELLEEFVQMQLVAYENLFSYGKQHFTLDTVDRRWAWFKRLLKHIDAKFASIFPPHWRLPLRLCLEFIERTKIHLVLMLSELESKDITDVHALLKALQSSIRFEQEVGEKFNLLSELRQSKEAEEAAQKLLLQEQEMQQKLKRDDKLMYIPTDHDAINKEDETESGFLSLANNAICGGISGVFDKFLGPYVLLERQNLEDMLQKLSQDEDTTSDGVMGMDSSAGTYGNVYGSSTNMFVFIKNSIKRCTGLTTGQTFLSLSKEFKTCMQQYVKMLKNRCPPAIAVTAQQVTYKLPAGGEIGISYLINTSEYCAEVVPQLELMIQQKMIANLANKVSFETEVEAFMDLAAHCVKVLLMGVMDRLDPAFRMMQSINWGGSTHVGEESSYLHDCNAVLLEAIPKIRSSLSSSYFSNLCTKLATEVLLRYLDVIWKQKRVTDESTQQLLLDTYNIKALMLQLPQLGWSSVESPHQGGKPPPVSPMYSKLVNSKVSHIEMVLKLISTPEEMLLERFRIMWPDGQPSDLQQIMSLKGTKRNDQQVILEMLGLSAASKLLNKTATTIFTGVGSGATSGAAGTSASSGSGNASATASSSTYSAAASAAALASSHMKTFTQDISSTARNIGSLKWTSSTTKS